MLAAGHALTAVVMSKRAQGPNWRLDLLRQKQSESGTDVAHKPKRGSAMGILDSLENSPALKGALGQLESAVLPVVLSQVLGNGSQGGLSAIVAKLQQAGLGDQVKSWLGNGPNLPITPGPTPQGRGRENRR